MFGVTCWMIWNWRNDRVCNGSQIYVQEAVRAAQRRAEEIDRSQLLLKWQKLGRDSEVQVGWKRPPLTWFKANCDGAVCTTTREAAAGGILRDDRGFVVKAFNKSFGHCTVRQQN
ncbi:OLC1v1020246C1 [Oldenlandia corymbosa var. corymbosa]|uniref:OLC1v1020246C1 n=1 Tax=Oldenlandia corymbosa var. corymbosa TaxID=529605 RepID=A0AAV1EFY8_OLDCO|nr:OLC1v1020246C1 [Oldenlandia corymbosa var. corymbosa]